MWWAFVDESEARVTEAGTTTAMYILAATLVEHVMLDEVRAERHRRKCLESLVHELGI